MAIKKATKISKTIAEDIVLHDEPLSSGYDLESVPVKEEPKFPYEATVKCLLNVRSGASTAANIVKRLEKGVKVEVIAEYGDWVQIGEGLYVMKKFISKITI